MCIFFFKENQQKVMETVTWDKLIVMAGWKKLKITVYRILKKNLLIIKDCETVG